jgi:polyketide synthase 13
VSGAEQSGGRGLPRAAGPARSAEAIEAWLVARVAAAVALDPLEIDAGEPFVAWGLGSVEAVALSGELEAWLGLRLPATLTWDYPTIRSLAGHLAERAGRRLAARDGPDAP